MDSLEGIQRECYEDSVQWFGEDIVKNLPHQVLALCGESGELANLVKKCQRGDLDFNDKYVMNDIALEIVDCFIYVVNLANLMKMNLGEVYSGKREFNSQRFGQDGAVPTGAGESV
jgi:NTP pyrophosphatase (non-canonical NTP hydrolase)